MLLVCERVEDFYRIHEGGAEDASFEDISLLFWPVNAIIFYTTVLFSEESGNEQEIQVRSAYHFLF